MQRYLWSVSNGFLRVLSGQRLHISATASVDRVAGSITLVLGKVYSVEIIGLAWTVTGSLINSFINVLVIVLFVLYVNWLKGESV